MRKKAKFRKGEKIQRNKALWLSGKTYSQTVVGLNCKSKKINALNAWDLNIKLNANGR